MNADDNDNPLPNKVDPKDVSVCIDMFETVGAEELLLELYSKKPGIFAALERPRWVAEVDYEADIESMSADERYRLHNRLLYGFFSAAAVEGAPIPSAAAQEFDVLYRSRLGIPCSSSGILALLQRSEHAIAIASEPRPQKPRGIGMSRAGGTDGGSVLLDWRTEFGTSVELLLVPSKGALVAVKLCIGASMRMNIESRCQAVDISLDERLPWRITEALWSRRSRSLSTEDQP